MLSLIPLCNVREIPDLQLPFSEIKRFLIDFRKIFIPIHVNQISTNLLHHSFPWKQN